MTSLEQMKAKAVIKSRKLIMPGIDVRYLTLEDVNTLIEATYNARTQEVVEIAKGMKSNSVGDSSSVEDEAMQYGYNEALSNLIFALSPEVKDDSK